METEKDELIKRLEVEHDKLYNELVKIRDYEVWLDIDKEINEEERKLSIEIINCEHCKSKLKEFNNYKNNYDKYNIWDLPKYTTWNETLCKEHTQARKDFYEKREQHILSLKLLSPIRIAREAISEIINTRK